MDRSRFDDLARFAASHSSRRTLLAALGGAAAAGAGGVVALSLRGASPDRVDAVLPVGTPDTLVRAGAAIALTGGGSAPGQPALATLAGFSPNEAVVLSLSANGSAAAAAGTVNVANDGGARVSFSIPAQSPPGHNVLNAAGQTSGARASVSFDIGCPPDLTTCAAACSDLLTDALHCGQCGSACGAGEICRAGGCTAHQNPAIDAFFTKFDGVCVDFDGVYGDQCMDLAEYYNRDVVGAPQIGGDAADAWQYYADSHYVQIPNGPDNAPHKGDLIVWNTDVGDGSGHIAVCVDADQSGFTSFDQNWPSDSCCHYQYHATYDNVLGWLRPNW